MEVARVATLPRKCGGFFASLRMTGKGKVGWEEGYLPTHRGETAMDEAPVLWWLVEENKEREAKTKTKYRDLSTAAASPPSVEMTFVA
ncbi:MAG TPA: hypothetical protein VK578_24565 [Edaphobacter sp.]|nr:hypothetical protein [Edaphobacter sp.]